MSIKITVEQLYIPPITIEINGEDSSKFRSLYLNSHLTGVCLGSYAAFGSCNEKQEILNLLMKIGEAMRGKV